MLKVPVVSPDGKPLMPTKPSRARRWIRESLAVGKWSDLGVFYVQLTGSP
ncbi:MAG: RRXRR domain-containing protein, partial [Desertifilum sp.]|nr:RRXRR domain-containing protein [Desertifilum sp.]